MTIQQEAYRLIDSMPDESVKLLVEFIQKISPPSGEKNASMVRYDENYRVANQRKLVRIEKLEDGWNGNGAKAISKGVIKKVRNLLDRIYYQPEIFPTACDSIQLEYDMQDGGHLEIEITENEEAECYYVSANGEESTEFIPSDVISINHKVAEYYGSILS